MRLANCDRGHDVRLTTRLMGKGGAVCGACQSERQTGKPHPKINTSRISAAAKETAKKKIIKEVKRDSSWSCWHNNVGAEYFG